MVTARSVNVSWNEIECIERNGMITNYTVVFSSSGGSVISGVLMVNERRFTASELTPFTNYTFQVAGINGNGTGPLSNVTIIQTAEDSMLIQSSCYKNNIYNFYSPWACAESFESNKVHFHKPHLGSPC